MASGDRKTQGEIVGWKVGELVAAPRPYTGIRDEHVKSLDRNYDERKLGIGLANVVDGVPYLHDGNHRKRMLERRFGAEHIFRCETYYELLRGEINGIVRAHGVIARPYRKLDAFGLSTEPSDQDLRDLLEAKLGLELADRAGGSSRQIGGIETLRNLQAKYGLTTVEEGIVILLNAWPSSLEADRESATKMSRYESNLLKAVVEIIAEERGWDTEKLVDRLAGQPPAEWVLKGRQRKTQLVVEGVPCSIARGIKLAITNQRPRRKR